LAKSAVDLISTAFEHTRQQLTQPFRWGQWVRLAVLALATGELSSGGGCSNGWNRLGSLSKTPSTSQNFVDPADVLRGIDPALIATMILVAIIGGLLLMLVWIYVSSISRFILFESVLRKHCDSLSAGWQRWQGPGIRYFWWQLALSIVAMGVAAVLFIPLLLPVLATLKHHQQPGPGLILAFLPMFVVFGIFGLIMLLIAVLAKDFVVPLMAVEGVGVMEGWRRLLEMMRAEKVGYAGYLGMKIVLSIGASVLFGILSSIAAMLVFLPFGIAGAILVIIGHSAGLTWNVFTITAAIVAGTVALVVLLFVVALVCVPVAVFFPAYAMYFLAERFPALYARLYPSPPPPELPPLAPSAVAPTG
jgi:hypothetical protein